MCTSKPKPVQQPAPAAPPPQPTAQTFKTDENPQGDSALLKSRRKGRSSLRINPTSTVGNGGTGVNAPN
jgi:hypothetical protein